MYIGADYYPEHWPEERWEKDAQLMRKAGFNVVRMAEFSWAKMEPMEGVFDFGWLEKALGVLGRHGIKSILGTPTASMPAWVANKYPETRALQMDGTRMGYGVRKDNCFTSGAFRLLSERITRAMAERFRRNPDVIGWQTDNELAGPECYCPSCRRGFQDWLRKKYGTLEKLNDAWGTSFWAHEYGTWGDIPLPMRPGGNNPSLELDHKRFHSDLNVSFQADQIRIIKEHCPGHFITHNFMGFCPTLNYFDLARDLDFVSWDNYPVWGKPDIPYRAAAAADLMRGLKGKNPWIMEQTSGPGGWGTMGRNPRPNEIRRLFFQQVAHGADGFVWFRWRVCRFGREQYWHGIIGHDGIPARRYKECARTAADCRKIERELEGTTLESEIAIVRDYDSAWALEIQPGFSGDLSGFSMDAGKEGNDLVAQIERYHRALFRAGVNADIVAPDGDFGKYKLIILPEQFIMPDGLADRIETFVNKGGVLLTDLRTGVKDENNICPERVLPGKLRKTLGIRIEEYESLGEDALIAGTREFPGSFHGHIGCEWVIPEEAKAIAGYRNGYLKPYASVTENSFGKGRAIFAGTIAREEAFYDALVRRALEAAGIKRLFDPPEGLEILCRSKRGSKLFFFINHTASHKKVKVPSRPKFKALLGDVPKAGALTVPAGEIAVLKAEA